MKRQGFSEGHKAVFIMKMRRRVLWLLALAAFLITMAGFILPINNVFVICVSILELLFLFMLIKMSDENQERLRKIAYTDSVTGGLNGVAFKTRYRSWIQTQKTKRYAVAMLNVREFRYINEYFGFDTGDTVLRTIYQCISEKLYDDRLEFVGRSETDHFFICLDEREPEQIQARLADIVESITLRLGKIGIVYPPSILTGCCIAEKPDQDIQVLKERARIAEKDNKKEYNRCLFYDGEIVSRFEKEAELDLEFEQALKNGEFAVFLQPKVGLKNDVPVGAEALIRWRHPKYGLIPPSDFIPVFERNGKICELDYYVFTEVCKLYQSREKSGKPWYPVSVNLSRYHFYERDFLDKYINTAREYNLKPNSVEIELTETLFIDTQQMEAVKRASEYIRKNGIMCSIDDFGAGYSSLSVLKDCEVDSIKLDRSFFVTPSERSRKIISGIINIAAQLKVQIVAEGIEEAEQVEFLRSIGCDAVQGFYFSKPLPIPEYERWVEDYVQNKINV